MTVNETTSLVAKSSNRNRNRFSSLSYSDSEHEEEQVVEENESEKNVKKQQRRNSNTTEATVALTPISSYCPTGLLKSKCSRKKLREQYERLDKARYLLYVSHLFAKGSETAWQFCLVLFLAAITNYQSFELVSTYGMFSCIAMIYCGNSLGNFIDSTYSSVSRLSKVRQLIHYQNISTLLATFFCYELLVYVASFPSSDSEESDKEHNERKLYSPYYIFLLISLHILGAAGSVLDRGLMVAYERDWIVVMSEVVTFIEKNSMMGAGMTSSSSSSVFMAVENICDIRDTQYEYEEDDDDFNNNKKEVFSGIRDDIEIPSTILHPQISNITNNNDDDKFTAEEIEQRAEQKQKEWLTQTNVTMRQIDLSCRVVGPALAGFLVAYFDASSSSSNSTTTSDHHNQGDLSNAAILIGVLTVTSLIAELICATKIYSLIPELSTSSSSLPQQKMQIEIPDEAITKNTSMIEGLQVFWNQSVVWSGFALSLLYLNMLCFGAIMTAYLVWRGMDIYWIGFWRGISALIGLCGTFCYNISVNSFHISVESTGLWAILMQFSCLSLCFISLYVQDTTKSLILLIGGVCISRIGLYVYDISTTQLFQINTPEHIRGKVGGIQESLNAFFLMSIFALGILFPDPNQFYILVGVGYIGVGVAALLYLFGFYIPVYRHKK